MTVDEQRAGRTVDFDHHSQDLAVDPFGHYQTLRQQTPVAWSESHGGFWIVSGYDDIDAIAHDPAVFSSRYVTVPNDVGLGEVSIPPLNYGPPDHGRVKRVMGSAFVPRRVADLVPGIRRDVTALIDEFADDGSVDASRDFARMVPIKLMCATLGLPVEDNDRFVGWIHGLLEQDGEQQQSAGMEVLMYIGELVASRRNSTGEDFISYLVQAEIDGERMEEHEVILATIELLVAGIDTTWSVISSALLHLANNEDDQHELRENPDLIPTANEEFLRAFAPVAVARYVERDTVFRDQSMHQGAMVLIPFASANRDEHQFPDPDRINLRRTPNRHFSFGVGIHRCLGANLARVEMKIAMEEFLRRIRDFRLAPDAEIIWAKGHISGPRRLPLVFAAPTPAHP